MPDLPRFNPKLTTTPPPAMLANYIKTRDEAARRRRRNQRIGDFALGCLFVLVGYIVALMLGGL